MDGVVGRVAEQHAIEALLDRAAVRPAGLVLEGPAGIGKTTLVRAAAAAAAARGATVLACTASASETRLAYTAMADLLRGVDDGRIAALPAPQREALEAALLRRPADPAGVDQRAVAVGLLALVEGLAREQPLVLAIDDGQWLDDQTARVIAFAARRVAGPIGLVAARRSDDPVAWGDELRALARSSAIDVRRLAPLGPADLGLVLRGQVIEPLSPGALARLHQASGGNPFFALELARTAPGGDPRGAPLPESLREIVDARLAGVEGAADELLLALALLAQPTVPLLRRALGDGAAAALDRLEEQGIVVRSGIRLRFAHPLLANGVQDRAGGRRRRAVHGRLSAVVEDVEERARHLAHAGILPDALPALERAAAHVRARGAPAAAAELLDLAVELGGDDGLRVRAAEHHFDAGDRERARAALEELAARLGPGEVRARALLDLAEIRYYDDSFPAACALLLEAREQARDDHLRATIDLRLACASINVGRPDEADEPARAALAGAKRLADEGLLAEALGIVAMVRFARGEGIDEAAIGRALALERPETRTPSLFRPAVIAGLLYLWTGRLDEARPLLAAACERLAERGEELELAWVSFP